MSKKLYRSNENRVLLGICGGIGEYFNMDPVIVRLILIVLVFVGFSGVFAYIIAAFIIPLRPTTAYYPAPVENTGNDSNQSNKQEDSIQKENL